MNHAEPSGFLVGRASVAGAGLLLTAFLGLFGCSSSSSGAAAAQSAAQAGASAIATASGATPATAAESGGTAGPVGADEFCALLTAEQPDLDRVGPGVGSEAQLTIAIANLYGRHNASSSMNGADMDTLAKSCPAVAAKALKSAGVGSFDDI